ncbi:MAG: hypothetical protein JWP91_2060 [Fibrobacteres bacterium]|nr:hypothetical protein [Fibrobacterota bacterium]
MKAVYLLVDLASIAFPLAFARSERFGFGARWKRAVGAVCISALPFVAWDIAFVRAGIWGFNPRYTLGLSLFGLPLEEYLFFLAIPFACLFIYRQFRRWPEGADPRGPAGVTSRAIWASIASIFASIALLDLGLRQPHIYTVSVFLLGALAASLLAVIGPGCSGPLLAALAAQYVPFLIVNGILTSLPVVLYRESAILGFRIGSIPVEDAAYSFIMLALPVALYEFPSSRNPRPGGPGSETPYRESASAERKSP